MAVLTALACLTFVAAREPVPLSLAELTMSEPVLMSCADAAPVSEALLWCSDPSSPQCIPAAPDAPRLELWDSPHVAALSFDLPDELLGYVPLTWQQPIYTFVPSRRDGGRLERPPRFAHT